jgi:hypothetical protein
MMQEFPPRHLLSKSSYLRSLQCSKSLYLYKFHYDKRDPLPEELKIRFQKGHDIGALAREKFPQGVNCQPEVPWDYRKSIVQTAHLVACHTRVIYEAAFQYNRVLAAVDILVLHEDRYCAYEVKSTMRISEVYLQDVALQYYVILKSGLPLDRFFIMHLNKPLEEALQKQDDIFIETDITDYCQVLLAQTEARVLKALQILSDGQMPQVPVGEHCEKPYRCDFWGFCHSSQSDSTASTQAISF